MIQFQSVFWFFPKNFKNNVLFFTGNLLLFSVLYLILASKFQLIFSLDLSWLSLFIALSVVAIIYNLVFYLKQSKRLGLLLLYGSGIEGVFLIVFFELVFMMVLAIIINIFILGFFHFKAFLLEIGFIIILCLVVIAKYFFTDIYYIIKE